MRARRQVLIRCADTEARRCHAFRLDVWCYRPVGQLDQNRELLRCILMDGVSPERVTDERFCYPFTTIVVLIAKAAQRNRYLDAGADRVLAADELGHERNAVLRSTLRQLTARKRGPRPAVPTASTPVADMPASQSQEVRLAA